MLMEEEKYTRISKEELLRCIQEHKFAVIELSLYLDTHPCDEKALQMQNEHARAYKEAKDKYEKMYGPLTRYYPMSKWKWVSESWPWERGNC